jgi:hypothetical protein
VVQISDSELEPMTLLIPQSSRHPLGRISEGGRYGAEIAWRDLRTDCCPYPLDLQCYTCLISKDSEGFWTVEIKPEVEPFARKLLPQGYARRIS